MRLPVSPLGQECFFQSVEQCRELLLARVGCCQTVVDNTLKHGGGIAVHSRISKGVAGVGASLPQRDEARFSLGAANADPSHTSTRASPHESFIPTVRLTVRRGSVGAPSCR